MKVLVPVKRVLDYNVKPRVKADGIGRRSGQRQDEHEPVRRDRGRRSDPPEGKGRRDRDRRRVDRRGEVAGNAAHRARDGCRSRDPGRQRKTRSSRWASPRCSQGDRRGGTAAAWSSSASRRSTTTTTRPARCSPALLGWGQGTFASKVEVDGDSVTVTREVDGGSETVHAQAARDRHHRPAPERAALCLAAQHHEGEVEADRAARRPPITASTSRRG